MDEVPDRLTEFPRDGRRWWIRWVDLHSPLHGRSASPDVGVLLSQVPEGPGGDPGVPPDGARLVNEGFVGSQAVRLSSGLIPRLTAGGVFQDGVQVGRLGAERRVMTFDRRRGAETTFREIGDFMSSFRPRWHEPGADAPPAWAYPSAPFSRCKALVLSQDGTTTIIPCFEIFRAIYAPQEDIAKAFTAGPWEGTWSGVADRELTRILPDGRRQIALKDRIRSLFAPVLSHLILDDFGRRAANAIHANLFRDAFSANEDEPARYGRMQAAIPFEWETLKLGVRQVKISDDGPVHLVLQITRIDFPFPEDEIVVYRETLGRPPERRAVPDGEQRFPGRGRGAFEGEVTHVDSGEDPGAAAATLRIRTEGIDFFTEPKVARLDVELAPDDNRDAARVRPAAGAREEGEPRARPAGSPGVPTYGQSDKARTNYEATRRADLPERFQKVLDMFDLLAADGQLSYACLAPDQTSVPEGREVPLWRFPMLDAAARRRRRIWWSMLDRDIGRRRTALLLRIEADGRTLFWMDIELRPAEGGKTSWLFLPAGSARDFHDAVPDILRRCARAEGVLSDKIVSEIAVHGDRVTSWRHSPAAGGAFSHDAAMGAIKRLLECKLA